MPAVAVPGLPGSYRQHIALGACKGGTGSDNSPGEKTRKQQQLRCSSVVCKEVKGQIAGP